LFIPVSLFEVYLQRVIKASGGAKFRIRNGEIYTDCLDTFPTLYFLLDGNWLEVIPESYVVDVSTYGDRSVCTLLLMKNTEDYWLLGMPLFKGYYAYHNMENSQIGFAPNTFSLKKNIELAEFLPYKELRFESVGSLKVAAYVIFILAVCVVYYRLVKPLLDSAATDCVRTMGELFYFASMLAVFKFFVFPILGNTFDSEEPSD
jgi:hypothetical protein